MPTLTLKSSGGDYTSPTSWEAARPGTLSDVEALVWDGISVSENVAISGFTTSAANYAQWIAASGQGLDGRPRDVSGVGPKLNASNADGALRVGIQHFRLEGIEISNSSTSSGACAVKYQDGTFSAGANDHRIERCLIHDALTGTGYTIAISKANLNILLRSCAVWGYQRTLDARDSASVTIQNCTFWRHADQFGILADTETNISNSYSGRITGTSECFWTGGAAIAISYCASSDASQATDGTNGISNVAGVDVFVSVTAGSEDFRLKSGTNALVNAGLTIGAVTVDAIGVARPQGAAYDIGAFERVDTGGSAVLQGAATATGLATGGLTGGGAGIGGAATMSNAATGNLTTLGAGAELAGTATGTGLATGNVTVPPDVLGGAGAGGGAATGNLTPGATTTRTTEPLENAPNSLILDTLVYWSWFPSWRVGEPLPSADYTTGTATTHATTGVMSCSTPNGPGMLMIADREAAAVNDAIAIFPFAS